MGGSMTGAGAGPGRLFRGLSVFGPPEAGLMGQRRARQYRGTQARLPRHAGALDASQRSRG